MQRGDAFFVATVMGVMGFIGGVAWGDFGHATNWLYDYQTLIAGVFAVGAAMFTVNARGTPTCRLALGSGRDPVGALRSLFLGG